jgi:hypothetical protein
MHDSRNRKAETPTGFEKSNVSCHRSRVATNPGNCILLVDNEHAQHLATLCIRVQVDDDDDDDYVEPWHLAGQVVAWGESCVCKLWRTHRSCKTFQLCVLVCEVQN